MWSSKSVIALSLITAVVAIIVSSFIRNKVNKYIEDCAVKLAQTKSAPAKNENFMASALNKIESNKKIYKILDKEMKEFIHSIQILIS